ncbi:ABC transporter permease [Paenibacillus campi]|uniref:ABC transporter permease n=1 Tax=Paenibacillus campi TaxID=3106031 RepID=UPI002AFF8DAE|nr:ABC transporter permease [Paenibacillus sp. SGZ-1014]
MINLAELRQKRRGEFWGQILPYMQYIIQSGVAVLTFFLLIAFAAWYTTFVQNMPAGLPVYWIMLVLLTPLTVYGSVRTYMRPADVVFMLPMETQMRHYFTAAWRGGMVGKSFWLVLLIIVASPFYGRAALDPKPLLVLIVAVLLLKAISNYGSWQELRMEGQRARVLYRLLRYVAIIGLLAALLWLPLGLALITLLSGAAVYVVCLQLPGKVAVPWERSIAAEKNHAAAVMRMLGWFVDVPTGERKVNHRRWLSFIGRKLPWQQEQAFRFLLVRTFIRTELLPTLSRFVVFGVILVLLARESWFGIAVYLLFIILAGMQMTMLRKQHTDTLWLSIYPLPPAARRLETIRLITLVQLVVAVVLWLPFVLTGDLVRLVGTLIVGLLLVWLQRASLNRKWLRELQLEEQFE